MSDDPIPNRLVVFEVEDDDGNEAEVEVLQSHTLDDLWEAAQKSPDGVAEGYGYRVRVPRRLKLYKPA